MRGTVAAHLGFTLIELLIVISILGILGAVLVPNLIGARSAALERAAQAYSGNVVSTLTAVMALDISVSASDVAGGTFNCGPGAGATDEVAVGSETYNYGWGAAPVSVESCDVTGDSSTGEIRVEITTGHETYVNGWVE